MLNSTWESSESDVPSYLEPHHPPQEDPCVGQDTRPQFQLKKLPKTLYLSAAKSLEYTDPTHKSELKFDSTARERSPRRLE